MKESTIFAGIYQERWGIFQPAMFFFPEGFRFQIVYLGVYSHSIVHEPPKKPNGKIKVFATF